MKPTGTQIYMLVVLALALVAIVLLATLTEGEHIVTVIAFLGGWVMPAPKGGGGGGGGSARRTGTIAGAALVVLMLSGCMSAVRAHATTATIATVALASFGDGVERATAAELATCERAPDPDACITRVEHAAETAAAAHDTVRPLVGAYRDGVETGAIAGDDASVIDALLVMGLRLVREWRSLAEAGRALGIEVPALTIPGAPAGGAP